MDATDDPDILHWDKLIHLNKRSLRVLEEQATQWGKLHVPPYIINGIEDAQKEIHALEQNKRRRIKHSNDNDILLTEEEVDKVIEELNTRFNNSWHSYFGWVIKYLGRSMALTSIFSLLIGMFIGKNYMDGTRDTLNTFLVTLSLMIILMLINSYRIWRKEHK